MKKIKVWDLPIRLFHWSLVVMIVVCIYTINVDNVTAHQYAGTFVLVLLLFRVLWGLLGSTTAKFWDFVKGPMSAYQYLRYGITKTEGHNPLGAYMVLLMLLVLFTQTITGLFLTDNTYLHQDSPLYQWVGSDARSVLKTIHQYNLYVIYTMVGLHVAAIVLYFLVKGQNLIKTLVVGTRTEDECHTPFATSIEGNRPWLALVIFAAVGILVPYFLYGYEKNVGFITWIKNTVIWLKGLIL